MTEAIASRSAASGPATAPPGAPEFAVSGAWPDNTAPALGDLDPSTVGTAGTADSGIDTLGTADLTSPDGPISHGTGRLGTADLGTTARSPAAHAPTALQANTLGLSAHGAGTLGTACCDATSSSPTLAGSADRALAEPLLTDLEPRFSWPLSPAPAVTRPFQAPSTPYGPGHRGVDLAAAPGQQVLAAGPGVVIFAGQVAGDGVVSIDHDGGLRTTYEPVTPLVAAGTQVFAGQPIATVNPGHPGCPGAACLHWGVRRGEEYLSPLGLIRAVSAIRLKPWNPEQPTTRPPALPAAAFFSRSAFTSLAVAGDPSSRETGNLRSNATQPPP